MSDERVHDWMDDPDDWDDPPGMWDKSDVTGGQTDADEFADTGAWKEFSLGLRHDDPAPGRGGWLKRWTARFSRKVSGRD